MKRPTPLSEIAAQVGCSTATVSRALKRPHLVREETRAAIVSAARKAGYLVADDPAAPRPAVIGMVVPDIENPFFAVLVKATLQELRRRGLSVILGDSNEEPTDESEIIATMRPRVDGIVVASSRLPDDELREALGDKPAVLLNRDVANLASVVVDYGTGCRQAVEHLAALGHRRIAYVEGPLHSSSNTGRRRSFEETMAGLGLEPLVFGPYVPKFDGGVQAADIAVARSVTALLAYNDLMAFGIMSRLASRGVPVPAGMSVVGFDDVPEASIWLPALSSVNVSIEASGRLAALALLRTIAGEPPRVPNRRLASQLVVRGSTATARRETTGNGRG
jgi:DNA-binding LacI/PurR family transcriptional regulator